MLLACVLCYGISALLNCPSWDLQIAFPCLSLLWLYNKYYLEKREYSNIVFKPVCYAMGYPCDKSIIYIWKGQEPNSVPAGMELLCLVKYEYTHSLVYTLIHSKALSKSILYQEKGAKEYTCWYGVVMFGSPPHCGPLSPGSIPSPGAVCPFGFQSKLASAGFSFGYSG